MAADQTPADALRTLLDTVPPPHVVALGEPTHGEPAFPLARNRIFEMLVEHGFRSIAIESDRVAGLAVDDFVRGGDATLDATMAAGFSHGFGRLAANRDLVAWMRAYNEGRPPAGQVSFHGFDVPTESAVAFSPRAHLEHLHGYLCEHLGADEVPPGRADLESLLGDDERWSDPATLLDPTRSVGASADAASLRAAVDDLLTTLYAHTPHLTAASSVRRWRRAEVHGRAALGLLRHHARAAEPAPPAARMSRLHGVRDAMMAQHLLDIRALEVDRGPTLVFAHNRHVQRHRSTLRMGELDVSWWSAGSILAALSHGRYAVVVGSLGACTALDLAAPPADTFEGALSAAVPSAVATTDPVLLDAAALTGEPALRPRSDAAAWGAYLPLDAETLAHADAVLHVAVAPERPGPTVDDLARRILGLDDVTQVVADEASGAPPASWGGRFFFVGEGRRMPFATIVDHDHPGFDDESRLDRPGVFRLNFEVGRRGFERRFGFPPADLATIRAGIDFSLRDAILPHPVYGTHGWVCVLNPGTDLMPEVEALLAEAHRRRRRG